MQFVYCWLDRELGIAKIGKTNTWPRFLQRVREAVTANVHMEFIGVWSCDLEPSKLDGGEFAAREFERVNVGSRAREWFRLPGGGSLTVELLKSRMTEKFGPPKLTAVPEDILTGEPWDVFGNRPKPGGLARLWLHRERRSTSRLLKLSDNSWWTPNLRPTWANTFNPAGFETLAGYEWSTVPSDRAAWMQLNDLARVVKNRLISLYGVPNLPRVAQIGWLACDVQSLMSDLQAAGLKAFDPAEGMRPGVLGQDEES